MVFQSLSLTVHFGDGEKGTGKTMTLCHVIHYCARQGWLVLHIPDGKNTDAVVLLHQLHMGCGRCCCKRRVEKASKAQTPPNKVEQNDSYFHVLSHAYHQPLCTGSEYDKMTYCVWVCVTSSALKGESSLLSMVGFFYQCSRIRATNTP